MKSRFLGALRRFSRSDEGTSTVEAVLWIPMFVVMFVLIADASLLFNSQAQMLRIVQDANRAYSTGQLLTTDDVEAWVLDQVQPTSLAALVDSAIDTSEVPAGVIQTVLTIPASDLDAVGIVTSLVDFRMRVAAKHYVEF